MNRTANGEGRRPLAGTSSVLASATVTEPGDETRPPRRTRTATGWPTRDGGRRVVTKACHETRNAP
jgi:hypothetical protein